MTEHRGRTLQAPDPIAHCRYAVIRCTVSFVPAGGRGKCGELTSDDRPRPVVLVVDDDADIADAITDVLRTGGYRVEVAGDGNAALARVLESPVNLVLLDWRLPGEPVGALLVRRIRDACG